ncbi:MAG TPA: agmatine deiminase family protein [Bryobacteraceae bacterium]|nr:agmatine deiminase family protein [Bryobacteraceae bacterium]
MARPLKVEAAPPRGFRMPAEWEPHEATWVAWPHEKSDWPGKFAPIPWLYGEIVRHLARVERVRILIQDAEAEQSARRVLKKCHANLHAIEFLHHPTNRSWTRDYAPIFIKNQVGEIAIAHWRFNGWAKYKNFDNDRRVPMYAARKLGLRRYAPGLVLEGGSIDVNGAGKMLTTEECLLSPVQARNPGISRRDLERAFYKYLGVEEVIWLGNGIAGDDTHGHVDDIARFTSRDTVVAAYQPDKSDPNHAPLKDNLERLKARSDLKVATLPMPEPVCFDGQVLPASYANFYIANKIVLAPAFSDRNDLQALRTLARLFPDREIIPIPCRDLVLGLGALHCMTQQQPS